MGVDTLNANDKKEEPDVKGVGRSTKSKGTKKVSLFVSGEIVKHRGTSWLYSIVCRGY